jgi:hypothetical protein
MRKIVATGILAGAVFAGFVGSQAASATSHPTLSTTSRTEVLISPKCYNEIQVTRTWYHWSKKAAAYVPYAGVKATTTTSTHCHA